MLQRMTTIAMGIAAAGLIAGCGADDRVDPDARAAAEFPTTSQMASISPTVLEGLKERYPVLREEPAPEPQPGTDANPDAVPERVRERLPSRALEQVRGEATFYSNVFEGRRTASGIPFRQNQMVAAHRAYPFGTLLRVTNARNERSVNVRVVDRGPFGSRAQARGTIIDVSRRAAEQLGFLDAGRAPVMVEVLEWGDGLPPAAT